MHVKQITERQWLKNTTLLILILSVLATSDIYGSENENNNLVQDTRTSWVVALDNNDTSKAVADLISALENEFEYPSSKEQIRQSWMTHSDLALKRYILTLGQIGPSISDQLRDTMGSLPFQTKNSVIISLGIQGDSTTKDDLRTIVSSNESPDLRAYAVIALRQFRDTTDIELFKGALADTFGVRVYRDYILEDGNDYDDIYPVREEAAGALREMGFTVTRDYNGNFTINEEK